MEVGSEHIFKVEGQTFPNGKGESFKLGKETFCRVLKSQIFVVPNRLKNVLEQILGGTHFRGGGAFGLRRV